MELKLIDGDYVPDVWGGFEIVSNAEEKLQRVLYKLRCRRGGFSLMPELGSRLYLLRREKKNNVETTARQYILEALSDEEDVELDRVDVTYADDERIYVEITLTYSGEQTTAVIAV